MLLRNYVFIAISACVLASCSNKDIYENGLVEEAQVNSETRAGSILSTLPLPVQPVPVVVYDFVDQTGQFRNNGLYTDYSSAVTKGGYSILVNALLNAGKSNWFTVAERGSLKNLLQERQIIKLTRDQYAGPKGQKLSNLPPLLYGGMMIEGGIVSYDSNVITGGAGAIYLGIGGAVQYRRDLVTVYLRAVSIQTGKVLLSVNSSKTIYSVGADANFLRYFSVSNLLQSEVGFTMNEPTQLGVRQAIETALYSMVMEGAINNLWTFRNVEQGKKAIADYIKRRDNISSPMEAEKKLSTIAANEDYTTARKR
jgi:curli production assembly/transport component CsgG